jgi:UDP:flavonoid glycosyltransferase YjiC (YdhE family)
MFDGAAFFRAAIEACKQLNRRGILLTRHSDHLPASLPDNVIHVDYAPFSLLLGRVAALVHHGGIGTSAQALANGAPSLVAPMAHDQFDNAERMRRLGVATVVPASRFTGRRVANALRGLLDSADLRRNVADVAARFEGVDGLEASCDILESLAPSSAEPTGTGAQTRTVPAT